jgi:pilus assembly protein Flp/PilA
MKHLFARFVREDSGQDLIEYALLAGLIALATITAVTSVATALSGKFNTVATQVTGAS